MNRRYATQKEERSMSDKVWKTVRITPKNDVLCAAGLEEGSDSNLYQRRVIVQCRDKEDSSGQEVIVESDGKVTCRRKEKEEGGWISDRRNGLSIEFEDEEGGPNDVLYIYQHKGYTYVKWAVDERD